MKMNKNALKNALKYLEITFFIVKIQKKIYFFGTPATDETQFTNIEYCLLKVRKVAKVYPVVKLTPIQH